MVYVLFEVGTVCLDGVFALYSGTKISFVRYVNDLFMKYSIPQALLAAERPFAEGVYVEFTVMPKSLICSHFFISLPSASSGGTTG